jgi:diaminopimelate epimerase
MPYFIRKRSESDFKMVYYNQMEAKGMCGNGGRCLVAFKKKSNWRQDYNAVDGLHHASVNKDGMPCKMIDVLNIKRIRLYLSRYGSHHVQVVDDLFKM